MDKWNKEKITRRVERGGRNGIFGSGRGRNGWRNFNRSKIQNKGKDLKIYLHVTGTDQQTAKFTKVKEHLILNIQSVFVSESDISESIPKGAILHLSKEILIKKISTEDEP